MKKTDIINYNELTANGKYLTFNKYFYLFNWNNVKIAIAGTAVPYAVKNAPKKELFKSLFYYFSNISLYSALGLALHENENYYRIDIDKIRKDFYECNENFNLVDNKNFISLIKKLNDDQIGFIDTISKVSFYNEANGNHNDNNISNFLLDEAFFDKNSDLIFLANSDLTGLALDKISFLINKKIKFEIFHFQKHGTTKIENAYFIKDFINKYF